MTETENAPCEYCGVPTWQRAGGMVAHQECYDQAGMAAPTHTDEEYIPHTCSNPDCKVCHSVCCICGELSGGAIACMGCWDEAVEQGSIPGYGE
jgi:hypothetical protein